MAPSPWLGGAVKLSRLSRSALLLSVLSLVAEPLFAEDEKSGSAPSLQDKLSPQNNKDKEPKPPRTPPGEYAKAKALDARKRALEAKKAGKSLAAERLEKAAATWEKVARHQEGAAKLEEDAAQIERKTLDLKSQARRARSLVEQTETRRSRAVARLRELGLSDAPSSKVPQAGSSRKEATPTAPSGPEAK